MLKSSRCHCCHLQTWTPVASTHIHWGLQPQSCSWHLSFSWTVVASQLYFLFHNNFHFHLMFQIIYDHRLPCFNLMDLSFARIWKSFYNSLLSHSFRLLVLLVFYPVIPTAVLLSYLVASISYLSVRTNQFQCHICLTLHHLKWQPLTIFGTCYMTTLNWNMLYVWNTYQNSLT